MNKYKSNFVIKIILISSSMFFINIFASSKFDLDLNRLTPSEREEYIKLQNGRLDPNRKAEIEKIRDEKYAELVAKSREKNSNIPSADSVNFALYIWENLTPEIQKIYNIEFAKMHKRLRDLEAKARVNK